MSIKPDIIGMDANEPNVDSYDIDKMTFYDRNGTGAKIFFKKVKELEMYDAYVVANSITTCKDGKCLTISHNVRRRGAVRYDFLFVNKNSLIIECDYNYEDAIMTGSDHALIEAYIKI